MLAGGRVAVCLDGLHRGLDPAAVGVLIAMFGFLPMLSALHIGRSIDRVGVARPLLVGTVLIGTGAVIPLLIPGTPALYTAAPLLGVGFVVFQVAARRVTGDLGPVLEHRRVSRRAGGASIRRRRK